ncbi:LLM class flavin-dependent oxidoreductase [Thermopolyspora sp. NPDC052614]|uniref:LLM class flavin-dependent oxidoreductase n=1 Tax=Thermopolyspora sp. NPDC052614 TaxID=3155682 RepID=UPI00344AC007
MSQDARLGFGIGLAGCQAGLEALPLEEAMRTLARAEAAGLDGVWVNEEHLAGRMTGRVCWATLPFLSYVAGRIPRIRLGSAALLLPLHHPLRLAEEIGSLCEFAPGRVCVGIAPNRPGPYAEAFGARTADRARDFDDCLDALVRLLKGDTIDITTEHHRGLAASSMVSPRIGPAFYRAAYSPGSLTAAAEAGMPLIQHYIQSPQSLLAGREVYRKAAGDAAADLLARSPVHRFVVIGPTDHDAQRQADDQASRLTERLRAFGIDKRGFITETKSLDPARFARETAIAGSPDTVLRRLADLAASTGTTTFNLNLGWMGAATADQIRTSANLLIEEVLPSL